MKYGRKVLGLFSLQFVLPSLCADFIQLSFQRDPLSFDSYGP